MIGLLVAMVLVSAPARPGLEALSARAAAEADRATSPQREALLRDEAEGLKRLREELQPLLEGNRAAFEREHAGEVRRLTGGAR